MFNLSAFAPNNQNLRNTPTKPLQNASPSYVPTFQPNQSSWDNNSYQSPNTNNSQETQNKEEMPYNIRVLLENEQETSSTSSDSEETDTMPEVTPKMRNTGIKEWDFGQGEQGRRKSEIVSASNSLLQTAINSVDQGNPRTWAPFMPGKVHVKPSFFGPLNIGEFNQNDKKAYFVTIEGFNQMTSRRFFKIERLCYGLQGNSTTNGTEPKQFLYVGLWNDYHNNQNDTDNIFEPLIYAIPHLNFRLVVKVYMTHAYEDPYIFDFPVDLRQFALPTKDKRTQSLEIVYVEQGNSTSPGVMNHPNNNITLQVQVTNEKLITPHGFKNIQGQNNDKMDASFDYSTILRQMFLGLPLARIGNNFTSISPLLPHNIHRLHDVYGKRGSAISLGQDRRTKLLDTPQSPISWSAFSRDSSPTNKFASPKQPSNHSNQGDPIMPPGIINPMNSNINPMNNLNNLNPVVNNGNNLINNNNPLDTGNFMAGGSLFKFNHNHNHNNRQQRFSIQPVRREPEEGNVKRQSSDLSCLIGEKGKVIDAYVQAFKHGHRKESSASESTSGTNYSMVSRFQQNLNEIDSQNQSNVSYIDGPEVIQPNDEGSQLKNNTEVIEEFKIDEYVGKMVDYAKTYQGSKVLQKYVATSHKDDLDIVVKEIGEKIGELMLDPYANYMIQTLVQNGYPRQRHYLLQKLAPSFNSIARDKKGTHSLQAIVGHIDSQDEFTLMRSIVGPYVFELSMDARANYVIQKLINVIPPDSSSFLYQPLFDNFVQVANNSFGLLVLKQMMARVEQKELLKNRVVELTCLNFEKLIQNPYGNYAIQHIVEYYPKDSLMIMNKILTKIIPYSSQKISSNVIEKCLTVCDSQFRKRVVEEILKNGRLGDLMKNKYGNFVTLQLLATSVLSDKQKLMQEILRCANSFNGTKYKTRWLKFIQENPMKINWNSNMVIGSEEAEKVEENSADDFGVSKQLDEEKLESVKRIWREMTKEEKSEASPFHYNNSKTPMNGGKKNYHKRDGSYGFGDK